MRKPKKCVFFLIHDYATFRKEAVACVNEKKTVFRNLQKQYKIQKNGDTQCVGSASTK